MNAKTVVTITNPMEMIGFVKSVGTQCRFVSMLTKTPVVKIKKNNPFGQLFKVSRKIGLINANYNTSVRRRIAEKLGIELKDAEYENGPSVYIHLTTNDGKAMPILVKASNPNDGVYYLQYFPHKSTSHYVNAQGDIIARDLVDPYLYAESFRSDVKPAVISVKFENIKELRASGVIMQSEDFEEAESAISQA